jgi:hypothetical protein
LKAERNKRLKTPNKKIRRKADFVSIRVMNKSGLALPQVLIFALSLAVVVGGYFVFKPEVKNQEIASDQNSTSTIADPDISDWLIYQSERGFEIRYPKNWFIQAADRVVDSEHPGKMDTDIPSNFINFVPNQDCENQNWEVGFGYAEFKTVCIGGFKVLFSALDQNAKSLEETIFSTFKFISPTSGIDTSIWQIYRNEEYGIEFKYPNTYHTYLDHNLINYDENKYEKGNPKGVKIQIQRDSGGNLGYDLSVSEQINSFISKLNSSSLNESENSSETPIVPLSLGIFSFKKQVLAGPGGSFDIFYTFVNKDTYYRLLVWGQENDPEVVSRILSTFKSIADTTNWQIYRNEEYGIEFKYPSKFVVMGPQSKRFSTGLVFLKYLGKEGTNGSAVIYISAETDPSKINSCLIHEGGGKSSMGGSLTQTTSTPSGIWYMDKSYDAGMSQQYDTTSFISVNKNRCFEFSLLIHTSNLGVYDPGTVTEFDATEVNSLFSRIFSTFKFTK